MPIMAEITDMVSLTAPPYDPSNKLYTKTSGQVSKMLLRRLCESHTPIQTVLITKPKMINKE